MDSSNWRPAQGGESGVDAGDWRSQLQPDSRHRIVNKIMETLKRHLPVSGHEGLSELRKIAVRFEEKIYTAATSQSDYLRKISLKMLTMETKSQTTALPSNSMVPTNKPLDSTSQSMQSQVLNQGPSMSGPMSSNQPQPRQQLLSQSIQNNIASQSSSSLPSSVPPVAGLASAPMANIGGQNPSMQNVSGVPQSSVGNAMGQGVSTNVFTNSQRPIQGRQVVSQQQQQQQQSQSQQQQLFFQQQHLQQQIMKQKYQQGSMPHQLMQSHIPQQQTNLMAPNQLPSSQQSVMQPSLSNLQQNQQSSIQQPTQSMLQQPPQPVLRQQQQSQQHSLLHQQPTMSQQASLSSQQQQQLINQQSNSSNMQQNSLIQNSVGDMQQQLPQQSRSHGQQSNLSNMQTPPSQQQQQQQQLMNQQSSLSNLQQPQLGPQSNVSGLQQQQMHGTQSGNSNMQSNQHGVHMMQQNKVQMQQQPPQNPSNLLSTQGQQGQLQSSQQLMSQIPLQSAQVQQQVSLQQQQQQQPQSNTLSHELQQRLQAGGQAPGPLLQSQNVMDQQKQLYHPQRVLPETSSTSLDSTAQTGQANGGDWQEEIYQKIKSMKELYLFELKEMYQKILPKVHQFDSLPQQPKSEQLNKLRAFRVILERLIAFLQVPKNNIVIGFKDKIGHYEKQIVSFLNSNRPRNSVSTLQQGQLPASHMQSMQQSQSQMTPLQSPENQINPQLHSANMQGSAPQQNMTIPMQPSSSLESGQGNSLSSLQQVGAVSLQQNPANSSQRANNSSLASQNGVNALQPNISSLQSNTNILQHQHMKQQDPQQLLQSQQQLKQQMQQRHMQHLKQQMLQHQQQQQQQPQLHQQQSQLQQQQPQLHQQQSQLQQQGKQQLPTQMQAHQMSHLNQIEMNDLKMRQGVAAKPGMFQHPGTQRSAYTHPQMKPGTSFPISPPIFQATSPQVTQNSSPQVDQQNMFSSMNRIGTPLQSASSPFVVPSPSTPLAPSPMPGDSEKPTSAVSSLPNAGNTGQQMNVSGAQAPSLAIGTPGISASPLLAEFSGTDGAYAIALPTVSGKSSVTEQPLERLIKAVKSMSPKALNASVSGIGSVVSMIDRIAGSAPGNGSRAAVGEDLVAMTKCRLQARNFVSHDGSNGTKRMRRHTSAMPLNVVSSAGSVNDVFKPLTGAETSDLESTATSSVKRPRIEANHVLLEEIREINQRLIDTVVVISDEVVDPSALAAAGDGSDGTIVKCSFSAVALSPSLKSQYTSAQMSPIQPLRLLVPTNYPNCSPILLDKFPVEVSSKEYEDLSIKAKSRFSISLRNLSQPMSLGDIARTWDVCARAVVSEYAQQSGGGSFCSKYGAWENCLSAA
ncbi:mediator of RNA polymerase II transcription subunit 15a-like isoform X3 [Cucurbita pepo subsp. pepo]|uniref:mediator of RNA polymerase II transcription subunit 15a-like isoform X3 n=1 Tax=Cucurbita pepo subsp. pepo TaxID=3664 RepID=UPI000C9D8214|nr:mediator of RNA polymerase II transcription subunit 15a-like isoform X3 [Cucurbita pepo subsp. pepo]